MENFLEIKNLHVKYKTLDGEKTVLAIEQLNIQKGTTFGLVGESGSGKTVLAQTIMGLLATPPGVIESGEILLEGEDLLRKTKKEMEQLRGEKMAMIFQDPMTFLNPVLTIGKQIREILLNHNPKMTKKEANERAIELMRQVGIPAPEKRINQYPFEFSGGMRQRIVIAIALANKPKLIIADEPTTALDVTIQARILQLILNLQKKLGIAVIFITHNLGVVAKIADYVNVMYAGKVVETGKAEDIFFDPRHPYTWGLLSSMPDLTGDKKERLYTIPGNPPNLANEVKGDAFAVRNPYALNIDFEEEPPMFEINEHHQAATWLLHPDAPKVEMPQTLKKRIEQLRREEKRYAETEGAYGTDE